MYVTICVQVTSLEGQIVAIIWKRWPGFNEDYNMDHDFFGLDSKWNILPCNIDKEFELICQFMSLDHIKKVLHK